MNHVVFSCTTLMERIQPMANQAIVVINHDPIFLDLMQDLLLDEGYQSVFCVTIDKASSMIEQAQPNLVVLDVGLGQYDGGWPLVESLRRNPLTATTPMIVCSTDSQLLRAKANELRAQRCEVLEKPFMAEELMSMVYASIGPPQLSA